MSDVPSGFPAFSLVTASSEAVLTGFEEAGEAHFFAESVSQFIPVGANQVQRVSVLVRGTRTTAVEIPVRIFRSNSPRQGGDGGLSARPLAEGALFFGGTGEAWLDWEVNLSPLSGLKVGGYLRLELMLPNGVGWVRNRSWEAAAPSSIDRTTFCFRVSPQQPCYWAANILPAEPGRSRFTGIWRSDAKSGLPQWIEVSWRDPLEVEEVELRFPDSDECPATYRIEVSALGGEAHQILVEENATSSRKHLFDPVIPADRLRIEFLAARRGKAVSLREIRMKSR